MTKRVKHMVSGETRTEAQVGEKDSEHEKELQVQFSPVQKRKKPKDFFPT